MRRLSDNVTVCIFAWNESKRLERCVNNFAGLFKVLVVDNASTDSTATLALKLGCSLITVKNPGFIETSSVMDPVFDTCGTEYIIIASVSEFIPLPLLRRYASVANTRSHDIVRAHRHSITAGKNIPISGQPRGRASGELRFLRRGSVDYCNNQVHDRGTVLVPKPRILSVVKEKNCHFFQFRDYDCGHTERKHAGYNDVLSEQRFIAGIRFSWPRAISASIKQFLNAYVRDGSWRCGMLGFIHSYYRLHMEFGIWLRIWELERGFDLPGVIGANDVARRRLEEDFRQRLDQLLGEGKVEPLVQEAASK